MYLSYPLVFGFVALSSASSIPHAGRDVSHNGLDIQPFTIDLTDRVPHMLDLVKKTQLPATEEPAFPGDQAGISLATLKSLRHDWANSFSWEKEQAILNGYNHFTTTIENLTVHFLHHKSSQPNAIPLILNHGWPGSFLEFLPVIDQLTKKAKTSTGRPVAFDVVVPSLPGYAFSSAPPKNWTAAGTARIFHTLMTQGLGYERYATSSTDLGSVVSYSLYETYNTSVRAAHFTMIPFYPLTAEQVAAQNITLSPAEQAQLDRWMEMVATGNAYYYVQTTKPNTIGLALQDNPVGQLAWIGEKFTAWSDPRAGTGPSVLTHHEMLRGVSLYYLTRSFLSSIYMYAQNPDGFRLDYARRAATDAPMLFSGFAYNPTFWPRQFVERVGNLVLYKSHEFGGHFPGLDNPPALVSDIREIGNVWVQ
ncbi:Alpha/Beta hydrolase protein [Parachaetomium inaequale]|uniref:Alpha/Beta hydrolase protein n=1 Tax=Parachaetomium inaequale TaxID=2588326 RepID=A0AAN6SP22_9PEZI|nr:Alpha/Beta hydrolase protein [Parachaetomium inaequale]